MGRAALGALTAGAVLRIVLSLLASRIAPSSDMAWYAFASRAIASGSALSPETDRALLYPVFLAGLALSGAGTLLAAYLAQAALTLGAVLAIGWYAARIGGARAGAIAAALLAPSLTIAQYSGLLLSEALFLPLFALWLALACPAFALGRLDGAGAGTGERGAGFDRPARALQRIALAGVAAGCASAARPAALPLAAGTCLALAFAGRERRGTGRMSGHINSPPEPSAARRRPFADLVSSRGVREAVVFGVTTTIVLAAAGAAAARAARVPVSFVPTAGVNLYLGNGPGGRLDGGGLPALPEDLETIADPAARNARAGREALREVARHPARALLVGAVRWVRLLSLNPGRNEHDALVHAGWPSALVLLWLGLEWALFAAGCAALRRAGPLPAAVSFTALVAAPYVLVLTVTFVQTRFRLPLVVLFAPFATAGLSALVETPRAPGARRPLVRAALGGVALVVAATAVELALKRL